MIQMNDVTMIYEKSRRHVLAGLRKLQRNIKDAAGAYGGCAVRGLRHDEVGRTLHASQPLHSYVEVVVVEPHVVRLCPVHLGKAHHVQPRLRVRHRAGKRRACPVKP